MPDEETNEEAPETPEEESSTSETEEVQTEKKTEEETKKEEPKVPLSRLREERKKRKELEDKLRVQEQDKSKPKSQDRSSEDEAEAYLRKLTEKVLDEREKVKAEIETKEDKAYKDMLDEFQDLDQDFDKKKFGKMVEKYKPKDEDAAWQLWQDLKGKPSESKPKPKLPSGQKTTDDTKETKGLTKEEKKMPVWEVVSRALKERGVKTED